jgi:hypothetical protein
MTTPLSSNMELSITRSPTCLARCPDIDTGPDRRHTAVHLKLANLGPAQAMLGDPAIAEGLNTCDWSCDLPGSCRRYGTDLCRAGNNLTTVKDFFGKSL